MSIFYITYNSILNRKNNLITKWHKLVNKSIQRKKQQIYDNLIPKCMKKNCQKREGGGNVGHGPMYLCFYDHNFPYVVRPTSILKIPSASRTRVSFLMQLLCGEVKQLRQRYIFAFVIQHVLHHAVVKSVPRTFQQTSRV